MPRLKFYFADLDDGLDVRVIRNVAHDFLGVRAKSRLKSFHGIELQLPDRQIRGGGARDPAADALFYGDAP